MNTIKRSGTFLFLFASFFANAQDLVWTGASNNNSFFDEKNWKNAVTNLAPLSGTIDRD